MLSEQARDLVVRIDENCKLLYEAYLEKVEYSLGVAYHIELCPHHGRSTKPKDCPCEVVYEKRVRQVRRPGLLDQLREFAANKDTDRNPKAERGAPRVKTAGRPPGDMGGFFALDELECDIPAVADRFLEAVGRDRTWAAQSVRLILLGLAGQVSAALSTTSTGDDRLDKIDSAEDRLRNREDRLRSCKDDLVRDRKDDLRKCKDDLRRCKDDLARNDHGTKIIPGNDHGGQDDLQGNDHGITDPYDDLGNYRDDHEINDLYQDRLCNCKDLCDRKVDLDSKIVDHETPIDHARKVDLAVTRWVDLARRTLKITVAETIFDKIVCGGCGGGLATPAGNRGDHDVRCVGTPTDPPCGQTYPPGEWLRLYEDQQRRDGRS